MHQATRLSSCSQSMPSNGKVKSSQPLPPKTPPIQPQSHRVSDGHLVITAAPPPAVEPSARPTGRLTQSTTTFSAMTSNDNSVVPSPLQGSPYGYSYCPPSSRKSPRDMRHTDSMYGSSRCALHSNTPEGVTAPYQVKEDSDPLIACPQRNPPPPRL
jgi:hypothetical protein